MRMRVICNISRLRSASLSDSPTTALVFLRAPPMAVIGKNLRANMVERDPLDVFEETLSGVNLCLTNKSIANGSNLDLWRVGSNVHYAKIENVLRGFVL